MSKTMMSTSTPGVPRTSRWLRRRARRFRNAHYCVDGGYPHLAVTDLAGGGLR